MLCQILSFEAMMFFLIFLFIIFEAIVVPICPVGLPMTHLTVVTSPSCSCVWLMAAMDKVGKTSPGSSSCRHQLLNF